jgi:hypothetical protein
MTVERQSKHTWDFKLLIGVAGGEAPSMRGASAWMSTGTRSKRCWPSVCLASLGYEDLNDHF